MFELPEFQVLAGQVNSTLRGKTVRSGSLGSKPHKFVWYNRTPEEFAGLVQGRRIGEARSRGKWLFIGLEPGYLLTFGECGGKMLYHPSRVAVPSVYHLALTFDDGSAFTETTQMWGAMELYEQGQERNRQYIKDMRPTPVEPEFTFDYFEELIAGLAGEKRSVKGLLVQEQLIPGLGNAIAQDILFQSRLHPRHALADLTQDLRRTLYDAIQTTVKVVIEQGGRYDETDLFGMPGRYVRLMDKEAVGKPCPACGTAVEKIQYLGGACYVCPRCQR